jgi:hypothetical protein
VLRRDAVFEIADGWIGVPQGAGLGLDVDEPALERLIVASS